MLTYIQINISLKMITMLHDSIFRYSTGPNYSLLIENQRVIP